ncbi:hypothetical protein AAC387_Pa11g0107 [Persea americana]
MYHPKAFQIMLLFLFLYSTNPYLSISATYEYLSSGSSLSVERSDDVIFSMDRRFSAGFYSVGDNAYCFTIWFTKPIKFTPVWMANRDQPVNGRRSTVSLRKDGNLVLTDAGRSIVWTTNTTSTSPVQLRLLNTGNLVLQTSGNIILWQSFDFPTDTLLPQQSLTGKSKLVASQSRTNYSSGFYSFYFDNDNVLRLYYSRLEITSVYWPNPNKAWWQLGRANYNTSKIAMFDLLGHFQSSDDMDFFASDFGIGPIRRLTMDFDGNLRLYSLDERTGNWEISWQAIPGLCTIHGLCGPNSLCAYPPDKVRCSCPPGFKLKDDTDWSQGCEPIFELSCDPLESKFIVIPDIDFYGYDYNMTLEATLQECQNMCLELCSCKAFLYKMTGRGICYPKILLRNGYRSSSLGVEMHIKVPRNMTISGGGQLKMTPLKCNPKAVVVLGAVYTQKVVNSSLKYLLWFVSVMGGTQLICIVIAWWYLYMRNKDSSSIEQGYILTITGFRKFTYAELKKATKNFSTEIGRGDGGVVYKAELMDERVAAVKRLEGVSQGEAEFLAEVSLIGRVNHMNLIPMWGYCAEKHHRLLVFEYMEHGSLAENLSSNALDWEKRFEIAVGTGKGLAYLHEECLEWVLHCDIKPQNILLDKDYQPKVSDFGLSKLRERRGIDGSSFSRIRGTRGYMAPEWIMNQPITSKVDVYSYGIVLLELVTGKRSAGSNVVCEGEGLVCKNLVTWVREMMFETDGRPGKIEDIMDQKIDSAYDVAKIDLLVKAALDCVEEDKDARPTMSQVVQRLLQNESDD